MPRLFQSLSIIFTLFFFTACASLTEKSCTNGFNSPLSDVCRPILAKKSCSSIDWFRLGKQTAQSGNSIEDNPHLIECRSLDAKVDEEKLAEGYKTGLDSFCDEKTAWSKGFNGREFKESALCSKEANKKARISHTQGAKDYCEPKVGKDIGREDKVPLKKCGAAWEAQYRIGLREFNQLKIEQLTTREKNLRENYYKLERKRIDLTEKKLRLVGHDDQAKDQRRKIELEILDVDREILKTKQDQELLSLEITNTKSKI
jgi:hypothetical protein